MGAGYGQRVVRRIVEAAFTLTLTITALMLVTFALSCLSPIDPAIRLVGDHASMGSYEQARRDLGLDKPWPVQFERYRCAALKTMALDLKSHKLYLSATGFQILVAARK